MCYLVPKLHIEMEMACTVSYLNIGDTITIQTEGHIN